MSRLLMGVLVFFFFFGCSSDEDQGRHHELKEWKVNNGKVKVLSTIAMIHDLVKKIGGEYVDCINLIKENLDPHSYQLVKGDDEKLVYADLIFYNGLGLEHGPSLQHHLIVNPKAISLGNNVQKDHPNLVLYDKGQVDPHIWMDIALWVKIIPYIVDALSLKDPDHADYYQSKGIALHKEMLEVHQTVKKTIHTIPLDKRYLVTSHDAFNYFTRAYLADEKETTREHWQKRFVAPEGLAPESQLSVTDIQEIIDHVSRYRIHVLFPESNINKDSIKKIIQAGREKGLNLKIAEASLYADAMGAPGSDGDSYLKMIQHNANIIAHYLHSESIQEKD